MNYEFFKEMSSLKLYIAVIGLAFLSSCGGMYTIRDVNFAQSYNPQNKSNAIETSIWHTSDSTSVLNLRFEQSNLSVEAVNGFEISYDIYDLKEETKVQSSDIDQTNIYINDSNLLKNNTISYPPIALHKLYNKEYLLKLTLNDLDRRNIADCYVPIHKLNAFSSQNYQLKDDVGNTLFKNYIQNGEAFKIVCNNINIKLLYVKYYKPRNTIAPPLYTIVAPKAPKFVADSSFTLKINNFESNYITLNNEGIYHFQADTTNTDGLTIYQFYDGFPIVKTPIEMIYPLRYLSTKKEYEEITQSVDYKTAVDKFWLEIAGNPDRAISLIKKYYTAVKDANRFFTSYVEGWRTDRGMIYTIYGPPTTVYRSSKTETWIYGESGILLSLKFIFDKIENPLTENDYVLKRDPDMKATWFDAVSNWRR